MYTESKVVSLIAVRLKSTRLPQKALLPLQGKPVLWHLADRVGRATIPQETVICTSTVQEDDPIAGLAKEYGFPIFRGSPENVLLRFLMAGEEQGADHIVRITGDNPLTDPFLIDEMIKLHLDQDADYTYTEDTPRGTKPEIISLKAVKKALELAENPNHSEYMTFYFKHYPHVFDHARYNYPHKDYIRPFYRLTLDTAGDYDVLNEVYAHLYCSNTEFTLLDVITFLDNHPEVVSLNKTVSPKDISGINARLRVNTGGERRE
jgi:spore coat polysaccharide biosynthesis protein SpsF